MIIAFFALNEKKNLAHFVFFLYNKTIYKGRQIKMMTLLFLVMPIGFLLGLTVPVLASRFGKILPADPGLILASLWHKPHFPKTLNAGRQTRLKTKWKKIAVYSVCWAFILMGLFGVTYAFISQSYFIWLAVFLYMMALSMAVDQQYFLLPDFFTIPLLFLGFGFAVFSGLISPQDSFLGALFGYLLTTFSVFIMNMFRPAEFGAGDVKMVTALGAWTGYMGLNYILVLSFAFFALWSFLAKKRAGAFGPALGVASILVLFFLYAK